MTSRGRRGDTPELQVKLLREGIVESVHHAHAVVCDDRGRVLLTAGQALYETFIRSSLKPFQAICVTSTGTLERFGLTDRDLAIICSSHQGTMEQVRQVFNILWRADIDSGGGLVENASGGIYCGTGRLRGTDLFDAVATDGLALCAVGFG